MNNKQTRRVTSKKMRGILVGIADAICNAQDKVTVSLSGNSFSFYLDGATINITTNGKGVVK